METEQRKQLTIMAHQGWQGKYPSNSYDAIVAAFNTAKAVEFDVYKVVDALGVPRVICAHPESYFLFVNAQGMKNEGDFPLSYEEAIAFKVGDNWQLMPDLEAVLDAWILSGCSTELQIELKGPGIPEVLVPLLQRKTQQGLALPKICLTGLCYPGDRSRIVGVRKLSKELRLVLPLRGGTFAQDGFSGIDEVLTFCTEQSVEIITIHRKNLTRSLVNKIRQAGFTVGTYHGRTTDELEAATCLGVSYLAADFMRGNSVVAYPNYSGISEEVYDRLLSIGFFTLRDWIWEVSWDFEKRFREMVDGGPARRVEGYGQVDAAVILSAKGEAIDAYTYDAKADMQFCEPLTIANELIASAFYGDFDQGLFGKVRARDLCSERGVLAQWAALVDEFSLPTKDLLASYTIGDIDALASSVDSPGAEREIARALLWRTGRVLGMLAFAALNPRHGKRGFYVAALGSDLTSTSTLVGKAAEEQFNAQLLRSGVSGGLLF